MSSPLCLKGAKTIIHAPQDCEVIKPIWIKLGIAGNDNNLFSCDLSNWSAKNTKSNCYLGSNQTPLEVHFSLCHLGHLAKKKLLVFQNKPFPCYLKSEISQKALDFVHCAHDAREAVCYVLKPIKWEPVGPST